MELLTRDPLTRSPWRTTTRKDRYTMPMTKWDFMTTSQKAAYDATPCGLNCSKCGLLLATEGDFARHFIISDRRYLNLGDCPTDTRTPRRFL